MKRGTVRLRFVIGHVDGPLHHFWIAGVQGWSLAIGPVQDGLRGFIRIGFPFSTPRIFPGRLKVLNDGIPMNLIQPLLRTLPKVSIPSIAGPNAAYA